MPNMHHLRSFRLSATAALIVLVSTTAIEPASAGETVVQQGQIPQAPVQQRPPNCEQVNSAEVTRRVREHVKEQVETPLTLIFKSNSERASIMPDCRLKVRGKFILLAKAEQYHRFSYQLLVHRKSRGSDWVFSDLDLNEKDRNMLKSAKTMASIHKVKIEVPLALLYSFGIACRRFRSLGEFVDVDELTNYLERTLGADFQKLQNRAVEIAKPIEHSDSFSTERAFIKICDETLSTLSKKIAIAYTEYSVLDHNPLSLPLFGMSKDIIPSTR